MTKQIRTQRCCESSVGTPELYFIEADTERPTKRHSQLRCVRNTAYSFCLVFCSLFTLIRVLPASSQMKHSAARKVSTHLKYKDIKRFATRPPGFSLPSNKWLSGRMGDRPSSSVRKSTPSARPAQAPRRGRRKLRLGYVPKVLFLTPLLTQPQ